VTEKLHVGRMVYANIYVEPFLTKNTDKTSCFSIFILYVNFCVGEFHDQGDNLKKEYC
jgi:hypothetical protein